jgi:hypothetical protein
MTSEMFQRQGWTFPSAKWHKPSRKLKKHKLFYSAYWTNQIFFGNEPLLKVKKKHVTGLQVHTIHSSNKTVSKKFNPFLWATPRGKG